MMMWIDTRDRFTFSVAICTLSAVVLIALLIGIVGPQQLSLLYKGYQVVDSYNCSTLRDHWDVPCTGGISLGSGATFTTSVLGLESLNQYVALQVFPFLKHAAQFGSSLNNTLEMSVGLYARNPFIGAPNDTWTLLRQEVHRAPFFCFVDTHECLSFYIVDEATIHYADYQVTFHLLSDDIMNETLSPLGDFFFQWEGANPAYVLEEMIVRIVFAALAFLIALFWTIRMQRIPFRSWTMEQTWCTILQWCLIVSNNVLYPLQAYTDVLFWPLLNTIFEALFISVLFLYCLFYLDMVRLQQHKIFWESPIAWVKTVLIFAHFVLSVALFMWQEVMLSNDPVISFSDQTGITVLFYFVAISFIAMVAWMAVLIAFIMPLMFGQQRERTVNDVERGRYLHTVVPMCVMLLSTFISLFTGSFGPFARTAAGFMFFHVLYNCVILFWVIGYWPVARGTKAPATDTTALVEANPFNAQALQSEDEL